MATGSQVVCGCLCAEFSRDRVLKADFLSGRVQRAFADLWSRLDDSKGASAFPLRSAEVKENPDVITW